MEKRERLIARVLDDLLDRMVRMEAQSSRIENKVDVVRKAQLNLEAATVELSKEVKGLRERLFEESSARAGVGRAVMEHDVQLSLIRGRSNGD